MKTLTSLGRIALLIGIALPLSLSTIHAQTSLDFVAFETSGVSGLDDLNFIDLNALIVSTTGGVSIEIENNSNIGDPSITPTQPTVTRIFFEDRAGVLGNDVSITSSSAGVSFIRNDGAHLPGGKTIGFDVDTAFTSKSPLAQNGLDPGESVIFLFNGTVYDALVASIVSGNFRIAMHVQEIGPSGYDSAAFVSVPEPGTAMLALLGTAILLRRRR
jgi:uncharacterized protein (TIGR03382 family)